MASHTDFALDDGQRFQHRRIGFALIQVDNRHVPAVVVAPSHVPAGLHQLPRPFVEHVLQRNGDNSCANCLNLDRELVLRLDPRPQFQADDAAPTAFLKAKTQLQQVLVNRKPGVCDAFRHDFVVFVLKQLFDKPAIDVLLLERGGPFIRMLDVVDQVRRFLDE